MSTWRCLLAGRSQWLSVDNQSRQRPPSSDRRSVLPPPSPHGRSSSQPSDRTGGAARASVVVPLPPHWTTPRRRRPPTTRPVVTQQGHSKVRTNSEKSYYCKVCESHNKIRWHNKITEKSEREVERMSQQGHGKVTRGSLTTKLRIVMCWFVVYPNPNPSFFWYGRTVRHPSMTQLCGHEICPTWGQMSVRSLTTFWSHKKLFFSGAFVFRETKSTVKISNGRFTETRRCPLSLNLAPRNKN